MIKASEFRLGNLITCDGEIFTIDSISEDIINAGVLSIYKAGFYEDYGIELTSEWLHRVNWQGYKDLYFNSNFCLDDVGHLYYHGDYTGINVDYVHQLQNLFFALTGLELELKK